MTALARFPKASEAAAAAAAAPIAVAADVAPAPGLKILTCGSVDDGKSTLIGRLLWDATDLYDDQRAQLIGEANGRDGNGQPDFSRLLDGLLAEREQGITIDVAWRYFDSATRRIVIIDSPGHEQYTRNMASGASHADVAILLVDARHGIKPQTRRHAAILDLMGVRRVILAVNKMDLVDYDEARFQQIAQDFERLALHFGFSQHVAIPIAAVAGANVATRGGRTPWYHGPTLLQHLESSPGHAQDDAAPFRMPVQMVVRDGQDFRGLAGTINAGTIALGDEIIDALSGRHARVARIATMDGDLERAGTGQAVVIGLDTDLDIARGDILASPQHPPRATSTLDAKVVWLGSEPFDPRHGYLLRTATDLVPISRLDVQGLLELETLAVHPAQGCSANDIALVSISTSRRVAVDEFRQSPATGAVLIVDAVTGATVAGGTVTRTASENRDFAAATAFVLDHELVARGLCRDLGDSAQDRAEFERRTREVAIILRAAGVDVVS